MGVNPRTYTGTKLALARDAVLVVLLSAIFTVLSVAEEFCERESFVAECNDSQVILMENANYGRMKRGRCLTQEAESLGCAADVRVYMDRQCSGRRQCAVEVFALDEVVQICQADLKSYLEADYTCIDVFDGPSCLPNSSRKYVLPSEPGFLSSSARIQNGVGSRRCPWTVRVQPGQLIEVVLFDFTLGEVSSVETNQPCPVIFVAIEADGEVNTASLCDPFANVRQKLVHTSNSNSLTFYLDINNTLPQVPYFVLRHQVIGCPDIETPDGAYVSRTADSAVFRCNATGETWYLVCRDVRWIGEVGNCTELLPNEPPPPAGFPWGILIAVAIGIGIGCVVGGVMLCILFACRKCYRQRKEKKKRATAHDLSKIEIPSIDTKQIQEETHNQEGIYSRPPGMGGPSTISQGQYQSVAGPSHVIHPEHAHTIQAQTHGWPQGQGPLPGGFHRQGSLPRESHARHMQRQHSLPKSSLIRRNSSEEHIYEKTPYDTSSVSSSRSGSLGRRDVSMTPFVPPPDVTPHYHQYDHRAAQSTIYDGKDNMRF